jgi:hypothetical protein
MAARSPHTQLKRARELAVKERRERKAAKKAARAAERRGETVDPEFASPELLTPPVDAAEDGVPPVPPAA